MEKPKRLDFKVYERVDADPEYKKYKGIVYNNHMYREALNKFNNQKQYNMTATIDKYGMLTIIPETELDQYALEKWVEENKEELTGNCKLAIENTFI